MNLSNYTKLQLLLVVFFVGTTWNLYGQVMPYYTKPSLIATLQKGISLNEINQKLGVEPYNVYHIQANGSSMISYKYRIMERRVKYRKFYELFNSGSQNSGSTWFEKEGTLYVVLLDGKLQSMITDNGLVNSVFILKSQNIIQFIDAKDLVTLEDFEALFEEGEVYQFSGKKRLLRKIERKDVKEVIKSNSLLQRNIDNFNDKFNLSSKNNPNNQSSQVDVSQENTMDNFDSPSEKREKYTHEEKIKLVGSARTTLALTMGGINSSWDTLFRYPDIERVTIPMFDYALDIRSGYNSSIGLNVALFGYEYQSDYNMLLALYAGVNYKKWLNITSTSLKPYLQIGLGMWQIEKPWWINEFEGNYFHSIFALNYRVGIDYNPKDQFGIRLSLGNNPSVLMAGIVVKIPYKNMDAYKELK